jgi:hypothetical protein
MTAVYMEGHGTVTPRFDMLEHATNKGHELAMYVLPLVLHRWKGGADMDAKAG